MDSSSWQKVDEFFDALLDLDPEQQEKRLRETDPSIADQVRRLLSLDRETGPLAEAALVHLDVDEVFDEAAEATQLGPWRIVEKLGRGGMGTVFRAIRDDGEYQQEVAVKILRRGLDTNDVLRRFENERQILARLKHPAITRLIDGGSTEDGRPWLVMELVDGPDLLEYCKANQPSMEQRLRLFAQICDAVQYAHQRLIVHRDIKPANILVTGKGEPRLLDFGIAKLLDNENDETRTVHRVLTPRWAAPEQLSGDAPTTATDVYALGLVLYQLLTGQHPFPDFSGREGQRNDSVRPSRAPSGQTRIPPVRNRRFKGDLDAIVMKALKPDPAERYESAGALAAEVRRFLAGESVTARSETMLQRTGRFLRKHRVASAATLTFFVLVTAWGTTATLQARRLQVERDKARQEAIRAEKTAAFIEGMLEAADPRQAAGEELTAREALQAGARTVELELTERPELQGRMRIAVGRAHIAIRDYVTARNLLSRAAEQLTSELGRKHPAVANALHYLAVAQRGLGKYEEAVNTASEALEIRKNTLFPLDQSIADTLVFIADTEADPLGHPAAARPLISEALTLRMIGGHEPTRLARTMAIAGFVLALSGDHQRGKTLLERALALTVDIRGENHPDVADILHALSFLSTNEEGIAYLEKVIAIQRNVFGPGSGEVLASLNNLALRFEPTAPQRSVATLEEAIDLADENLQDPTMSIRLRANLGAILRDAGQFDRARHRLDEARDIAILHQHHRLQAWVVYHLARLTQAEGNVLQALELQREGLRISLEHSPEHHIVPKIRLSIAELLRESGRLEPAANEARAAIQFPHDRRFDEDAWIELGEIALAGRQPLPDDVSDGLHRIESGSGARAQRASELLGRARSATVD